MNTYLNSQKRFSYRRAKSWNALGIEAKQAPSFSIFKQKLLSNKNFNLNFSFFFHFKQLFTLIFTCDRIICSSDSYLPFNF